MFSKNGLIDQSYIIVHTNVFANPFGHTLYPLTDIQADFEINRPIRYRITENRNYFHRRQTDRQTDGTTNGRTDGQTSRTTTVGIFFRKKKKVLKIENFNDGTWLPVHVPCLVTSNID